VGFAKSWRSMLKGGILCRRLRKFAGLKKT